jgi:hypothetical protein
MTEKENEILALLHKLAGDYAATLATHKAALDRHEANLAAAHKKLADVAAEVSRHSRFIDAVGGQVQ